MGNRIEPLFVRYLNKEVSTADVVKTFISLTEDLPSKEIAEETLKSLPDLGVFHKDFKAAIGDLIDNGVNQRFVNYVDSYMKPSLMESVSEGGRTRVNEKRVVFIKERGTPWIEALLCYGVILYIKVYGVKEIKKCPSCSKIFTTLGKYAKYCSESCKAKG